MIRMVPTNSSNLTGVAYSPGDEAFYVCFRAKDWYWYGASSPDEAESAVCAILFDSESQGKRLKEVIAGRPYRKLEDDEVESLDFRL